MNYNIYFYKLFYLKFQIKFIIYYSTLIFSFFSNNSLWFFIILTITKIKQNVERNFFDLTFNKNLTYKKFLSQQ